jgi:uncharacterized damage-inducible protein DinB
MRKWHHGKVCPWVPALLLSLFILPGAIRAQTSLEVRDELMGQFNSSMRKMIALADAMPAETYTWSPGEGVMEVGHVYMHLARYNYLYPTQNLGKTLPDGIEMDQMELVREKDVILAALRQSQEWVEGAVGAMSAGELAEETQLYGRDVAKWAVLVQLISHMKEHVGQSIAYARMNGVVPPWSR